MPPSAEAGAAVTYEESEDGIAVIALNRPERRNAIDDAVADGLAAAWRRASRIRSPWR